MVKTVCTSGKFIAKLLNYIKLLDSYGLLISWSQKNNFFFESKITSHVHMFYFINVISKRRVCYRSKVISVESFLS